MDRMSNERSVRSVFVGNIPYDATEEQLKDVFSQAGPVVSFRLVYDRDTGKPKGYGFCEYNDKETAISAMRNLNNTELNGRMLRVDNAANERGRDENEQRRNVQQSGGPVSGANAGPIGQQPPVPTFENPYGPECNPQEAPELISRTVAGLPPEQMFELAKQIKTCIENNPNEARVMLVQNPQLSYALLQALVVMKIVDPQVASSILHRPPPTVAPLMPQEMAPQPWQQDFGRPQPQVQNIDPRLARSAPAPMDPRDPRFAAQQARQGGNDPSIQEQQDRAALVLQLLSLPDEQIRLLTPEQQRSIHELRQQMNR